MTLETYRCVTCGSREHRLLFRKFDLPVSRCRRCGLICANPRLPKEEIWKRYNPDYFWKEYLPSLGVHEGEYCLDAFDARYQPHLSLLADCLGRTSGQLLELGAGAGFFLKAAEHAGWSVIGTELSEEAVQFAQTELALDVVQMDVESLDFPDESSDAIVAFELLEHLLNPLAAAREAHRVLRPGGVLLLSTPNYRALSRFFLGKEWHVLAPAEHLSYFTEATLEELLGRAGFVEVEFEHQFEGFGIAGTMSPLATHAPDSLRARLYRSLVERLGQTLAPSIQRLGRGDTLLCVARRTEKSA